jgi:hypothetical protein
MTHAVTERHFGRIRETRTRDYVHILQLPYLVENVVSYPSQIYGLFGSPFPRAPLQTSSDKTREGQITISRFASNPLRHATAPYLEGNL